MQGRAHLITVAALLGFLAVGSVALRTLTRLAGEDGGSVLSTPACELHALAGGVLEARPKFASATWRFRPASDAATEVRLDRAVFAVTRDGPDGPITRYWLNHVTGACPKHGELECKLDDHGRLACEAYGVLYDVEGPEDAVRPETLARHDVLGR